MPNLRNGSKKGFEPGSAENTAGFRENWTCTASISPQSYSNLTIPVRQAAVAALRAVTLGYDRPVERFAGGNRFCEF